MDILITMTECFLRYDRRLININMRNKSNQDMQDKWWKDLRRLCGAECEDKWFDKLSEWKLGDGGKTKFWEDNWLGEECLATLFPRMYLNSCQQHACIKDVGSWTWSLCGAEVALFGRSHK